MYQAIQVKYLDPTNFLGSRYKATASAGSITIPVDNERSIEDNVIAAAQALCDKFGWSKDMVHGQLADGSYVLVQMCR